MDILERFPNKYSVTINHGSPETKGIFKNYIMNNGVTTSREYEENGVVIINRETCLRVTPLGIDKVLNSKILPGKYELKKAQEKYNKNNMNLKRHKKNTTKIKERARTQESSKIRERRGRAKIGKISRSIFTYSIIQNKV